MTETQSISLHRFAWNELVTTDHTAAKEFYTTLFGWTTTDDPTPDGGVYTHLNIGEESVGAVFTMPQEMRDMNIPPHWGLYVSVEDCATTVTKARELGATVLKDTFEIPDVGHFAVLQDPSGATIQIWQTAQHHGVGNFSPGQHATPAWHELMSRDADAAIAFYTSLFGWEAETVTEPMQYTTFSNNGERVGGLMAMVGDEWGELPSHWMLYFNSSDVDATAAKVDELGGKVCVPPTDIPTVGRFTVVNDPQGALFSVITFAPMTEDCSS